MEKILQDARDDLAAAIAARKRAEKIVKNTLQDILEIRREILRRERLISKK